jgi:hypothetical protein
LKGYCHVAGGKRLTKLDFCSPKGNRQKDGFDGLYYDPSGAALYFIDPDYTYIPVPARVYAGKQKKKLKVKR